VLLLLASCTWAVQGATFRTREAESAFERAIAAVEAHCHGSRFANPDAQIVTSHWQATHSRDGAFLTRCQVALARQPDELGAEVRVAVTIKQCPLVELAVLDALGDSDTCQVTFTMPTEVSNQLQESVRKVEYDVRR
jgi:hypothetical protein